MTLITYKYDFCHDFEGQKKRPYLYDPKFPKCSYKNSEVL